MMVIKTREEALALLNSRVLTQCWHDGKDVICVAPEAIREMVEAGLVRALESPTTCRLILTGKGKQYLDRQEEWSGGLREAGGQDVEAVRWRCWA